ncbi:GNAT family N-acetyltransferase [Caminibacter mediatlanticus TB-2]|uniref:GNAT family N-acetyltransferase n=1 Tax=Caminibacter mediatlanticus TB-2 TaxID=391592 RepID=A0ABX5V8L8_9BACT|nr:GNAT family N-acetyltransferase [Caminibacter mediatlanticus]QCT93959.1 GNAT family N-acetyltransferase [Caminibacter mediatlanticus TB-2]
MKFEWITNWDEVWNDNFIHQWNEWMDKSKTAHVFFNPDVAKVWVDTFMPIRDIKPMFCIAKYNNTTIFLPLILWRKNWKNAFIKSIIPLGYSDYDYHDPIIIGDEINMNLFWEKLIDNIYKNFSYDEFFIDGIYNNNLIDKNVFFKSDIAPYIDLRCFNTFDDFLMSLKSKARNDYKRQLKRLSEIGNIEYKVFLLEEKTEAINELNDMLYFHSKRWPNAYKAPYYHFNLINNLLDKNLLHFSTLKLNNTTISWNLSFKYKKKFYFYMPAYNEKYNKYSPGKLIMFLSLKDSIEKNFLIYDLLKGAENYKKQLPVIENDLFNLYIKNTNLLSIFKFKINSFKRLIK